MTIEYEDVRLGGTVTQRRTGLAEPKYLWTGGLGEHHQVDLAHGISELGPAAAPIVLTEGGRKARAVRDAGYPAVGFVSASTIPSYHVLDRLAGRSVVLWPDNDDIGRAFMGQVGQRLDATAGAIRVIHWIDAPEHGDAADCSPEVIRQLVADSVASYAVGGREWHEYPMVAAAAP